MHVCFRTGPSFLGADIYMLSVDAGHGGKDREPCWAVWTGIPGWEGRLLVSAGCRPMSGGLTPSPGHTPRTRGAVQERAPRVSLPPPPPRVALGRLDPQSTHF